MPTEQRGKITFDFFPAGTIVVETLSDEDVARLMAEQNAQKQKLDNNSVIEISDDDDDDIVIPSVIQTDDDEIYLDLSRISGILGLFDENNERVTKALEANAIFSEDPTRFLATPNEVLIKLFIQSLWEDENLAVEGALELVLKIVNDLGSKRASDRIDAAISKFVDEMRSDAAASAESTAELVRKARSIVRATVNARDSDENLESFFERALAMMEVADASDEVKRYLAVNPVIMELFSKLKERVILTDVREMRNKRRRGLPDEL